MDIYDEVKKRLEKLDQKKLLIYTIIISTILIIAIIFLIIYVNKMAAEGKHLFDPSGKRTEKRIEEELNRQDKILEDPEVEEIYNKLFVDKDFSF